MKYTVQTRHFAAGRFWDEGDEREAEPADVAPLVEMGVLKAKGPAKTKSGDKVD